MEALAPTSFIFAPGQAINPNQGRYDVKSERFTKFENAKPAIPTFDCDAGQANAPESWAIDALYNADFAERFDDIEHLSCYSDVLTLAIDVVAQSPTARLMLSEAINEDWHIALDELPNDDFQINVSNGILLVHNHSLGPEALVKSEHFLSAVIISLVRGLRDIWQEKRYGAFETIYGPEEVLMLERARAADTAVLAVLVAWELRSEDYGQIWRHLLGEEDGDIALAFSAYLEKDPSSAFSGSALSRAFTQWYLNHDRVNECDHETLEYMDDLLHDSCREDAFGPDRLTPGNLELISCLPNKTAYLRGEGAKILHDPSFAGLHDPINQTHFFHIMYDMEVVYAGEVPFRSRDLAQKIFPGRDIQVGSAPKS